MSGLDLVAVQASLTPDTPITFRPSDRFGYSVVSLGGVDARITVWGSDADLRRLADTILAGLAGDQS